MENVSPHGPRIDLAKLTQGNPARMLISPPPEEELRQQRTPKAGSVAKRKRAAPHAQQLTPNPKPRKQGRSERTPSPTRSRSPAAKLVLHSSPHLNNPIADYLPPAPVRRSATPVLVPYEPPTDVFTPPREVIITPTTHTAQRRPRAKPNSKLRPLVIKDEPPEIDLSEPMPPASPTDDPLLLTGPPSSDSLPPSTPPRHSSSPLGDNDNDNDGWGPSTEDSMDLDRPAVDILFPNAANLSGSWTDSDDDDDEDVIFGESEFTGRWRMMRIPTKQDPPSSATRARMDSWGRHTSPHPDHDPDSLVFGDVDPVSLSDEEQDERAVRALSLERDDEVPVADYDDDIMLEAQASPPKEDSSVSSTGDSSADTAEPLREEQDYFSHERSVSPSGSTTPQPQNDEDDNEAEEAEVRALSMEREVGPSQIHSEYLSTPKAPSPRVSSQADMDESEDESDAELDLSIVKISSKDPHAAATVTAILKQYNYDCYTRNKLKEGPRRKTLTGGIQKRKALVTPVRQRSTASFGGVIGDKVYIPGSPVTTLDNLLEQAEVEINSAKAPTLFRAPDKIYNGTGEQWTKEEWKVLDMCFTEERYELNGGQDMADVDKVDVLKVVARFEEVVPSGAWTRDDIERRTLAIANKQRAGIVAPPLTPRGVTTRSILENPLDNRSRRVNMDVPDFTPLGRRAMPPARLKKVTTSFHLPEPISQGAPFQNLGASVLLAPRYSHLLDEAHAVASGKPKAASLPEPESESEEDDEEEEEVSLDLSVDNSLEEEEEEVQDQEQANIETPSAPQVKRPPPRTSIGNRVKGFLFSYLPSSTATATAPVNRRAPSRPGLPLPPIDLLSKPRGPITTPVKAPEPKAKAPKELVDLNHVQEPKPKSRLPRKVAPRRMVELTPVAIEEEEREKEGRMRPRTSSGASVKDMIRGFEEMRKSQTKGQVGEVGVKRTKSVGDLKGKAGRPVWR